MKKKFIALYLVALLLPFKFLSAQQSDTLYYTVVSGKTVAGIQKSWSSGSQVHHYFFEFNDRGRGSSIYEDVNTDKKGWIISSASHGLDYYKNPYTASFNITGDSATSIENAEKKTKPYHHELYTSLQCPATNELLVAALLNQPNHKAAGFGGTMSVKSVNDKTIPFQNKTLHLLLCEIYYDENNPPVFIWLNQDKKFFASVSDWVSIVQRGYETLTDTLNKMQEAQGLSYYASQMNALSKKLAPAIAITHVRLYDAENAVMEDDMTVTIKDGKIEQVGKSATIKITSGYEVMDGSGKTLLPGLWDMHGHYGKEEGLNYLAGGVTHVRDMGNGNSLLNVRDAIRRNEMLGPDISYISGFIDQAGPYQGPTGVMIHNLQEGIAAVDDYANRGYQQIKLYSSIDPAWVKPLAAEAHQKGMRVAGHIPAFMTASEAVNDGYDEITHINMLMLNFLGDTIDTRTPQRFSVVGRHAKDIDLNGNETMAFIQLLKSKNISVDPTMNVFYGMFSVYPGDTDASDKPIISWMPADRRDNITATSSFAPLTEKETYLASYQNMMAMLKKLYDNNILIVSGTDGGEAFALEHELELYVQAGIPPLKALQCATWNAAKDCSLQNKMGTIAAGREADIILVDGNPAVNISDIRRVRWVIKNNRTYDPKQLLSSIGWSYYY